MPTYLVTERQVIDYSWEVEATTAEEACDSAIDGVPDYAASKLKASDVTAEEIAPAIERPEQVDLAEQVNANLDELGAAIKAVRRPPA